MMDHIARALHTAHGFASGGAIPTVPTGLIDSAVPGRTDAIPTRVPPGSYVVPADVVSGIGEGNTQAGARVLDAKFNMGPQGLQAPTRRTGGIAPANGGAPVDIITAGGEYIIKPDAVRALGGGNIKHGHDILDAMVKHLRKKIIAKMKSLPGPQR